MTTAGEDRWHPRKGATCEADPRRAEIIKRDTGAERLKTISTLAAKETGRETEGGEETRFERAQIEWQNGCKLDDDDDNGDTLSADEVTRYRRIATRANFVAHDRMDIAFATKEATERMTSPTQDDWNKLVRIGRVVNCYEYQMNPGSCSLHRFRVGWVQEDEKVNIRRMHPQRTAHA